MDKILLYLPVFYEFHFFQLSSKEFQMPIQVFGAQAAVSMVNRALANTSPSNSVYLNQVAAAGDTAASQYAFAGQLGAQFAVGKTEAQLSAQVMSNIGVSNAILEAALTDYITFHGKQNIGIIALQLGQIISNLEGDVTFGAAATKWNQEVTNAYQYSSSTVNNTPQTGDDAATGTNLTRFTDVLAGHEFKGFLDYNQFTGADEQTLTTSDRLTGTDAADDLLFAQLTGNARPTLNGIEIVSIDAKANAVTLDLSDANGVKTVINAGSSEAATLNFNSLKNLVNVVIRNTNSDTAVTFNPTVVAGAADALNLTVEGSGVAADRANFTVNGIETLNITAAVKASVLGAVNTGDTLSKLVITGDQNLSVGTKSAGGFNSTAIATVDASAATGNLTLNLTASAARDQTVTTGTGNDVVVTGDLKAADTFTLGAGNDRLVLTTASTNEAAKLVGVEEVEARFVGTSLNLTNAADVKLLAVADLGVASVATGAGFANVTAVKSGTSVVFEGRGALNAVSNSNVFFGNVTYNLANANGTTDVIDFKFNNAGVALGANSTVTIGALNNTGSNVETLNFAFSDVVATNTVTVTDISASAAAKTLTVASDSKVNLGTGANDLLKLTSVDASGVKAGFTATFGALGDVAAATIKLGGSGVNNLTVGKAADTTLTAADSVQLLTVDGSAGTGNQSITITGNADVTSVAATTAAQYAAKASVSVLGGAGNDSITVTSTAATVNLIKGGAGADTIALAASAGIDVLILAAGDSTSASRDTVTNFVTGTDKIDLSAFGFDTALQGVTTAGTALNGTAAEFGGKAVYVDNVNNTLYVDVNGDNKFDASDLIVNVTGVAVAVGDILFA